MTELQRGVALEPGMKILVLAILVAAVWIFVGYSYNHHGDQVVTPETSAPTVADAAPARIRLNPYAATPPPATPEPLDTQDRPSGPLVLFNGLLSQKMPAGNFLIRLEKTYTAKDGKPALEHPWHQALTACEIDGEYLLIGLPDAENHVDHDMVGGIAVVGNPYSFKTAQGETRTVHKLFWVDPKTVTNYQPPGAATPSGSPASKTGLQGSALDKKAHR